MSQNIESEGILELSNSGVSNKNGKKTSTSPITFEPQESHPTNSETVLRPISSGDKRKLKRISKKVSIAKQFCNTPGPLVEGVNEELLWSEVKTFKTPALLVLWWSILALVMAILSIADVWSDCSVAYLFYQKSMKGSSNYKESLWWKISVTVSLTSYLIQCCFAYYEVTHHKQHEFGFGRLGSKRYAIALFILLPWIIVGIGIYDTYKNKYTRRLETAYIMMFIEVLFESIAQSSLQLNAIIVYSNNTIPYDDVTVLQWVSLSITMVTLSTGIAYSVIFYNNSNATQLIKFLFCVFGGITVVSRLLLCSSWGLRWFYLWSVPFLAGLLTTSLTWLALRRCSCFGYKEFLNQYDIYNLPMTLTVSCSWLTSFIFNCFSPSGIPVSALMCLLAVIDYSLKIDQSTQIDQLPQKDQSTQPYITQLPQIDQSSHPYITLHLTNICLTTFVLICNIIFSFVPKCHIVSKTWIDGEGEDDDDPYHFRFY
ncbi:unnamed protein product [Meganyctiphanes norvegica]|uniref:Uncharacterized protein n=1 Tax=Meganyctiphanes norvegica TaxID=48144 RepID=A0AAV2Q6B2_MEGNR